MHYHITKYAQRKKIIQICSIKIQFYIILHFYFLWNNAQLISPNLFKLMRLSDCTFLNIENDPSTSQEVADAYICEEIWGKVSLY